MSINYSVITYIFGDSSVLREVKVTEPSAEYICVTDDPSLTSETWTVVVDDYLLNSSLTSLEREIYARTHIFNYVSSDVVFSIGKNVCVLSSLTDLSKDFIGGGCDMRLMLKGGVDALVGDDEFMERASQVGFDCKNGGLIDDTLMMLRRTNVVLDFLGKLHQEFFTYSQSRSLFPVWMTYMLGCYYAEKMKLEFYGGKKILYSKWFQIYMDGKKRKPPFKDDLDAVYFFNGKEVGVLSVDLRKNDVTIFVGAHHSFENTLTDSAYTVICPNDSCSGMTNVIKCELPYVLKDWFYSETYMLTYVARNVKLPKYVGFCHFRKHFDFENNIPDFDEIFSQYDACAIKPIKTPSGIRAQYNSCHNVEDLDIVGEIISWKYKDYKSAFAKAMDSPRMFPYNMFVMKRDDFLRYIDFVNGVLDEYIKMVGTDIDKRIKQNKKKYIKKRSPNDSADYQRRIGGYLVERLLTVFILKNFKTVAGFPVIITEKKYANEKVTVKK